MDEKEFEQAAGITENLIDAGVSKARIRQNKPDDFEGYCRCGEEVPHDRIKLGYYNCTVCQTKSEERRKFYK